MSRKVLLVEPNYRNKYPPIGLMKISTYHKMLGDEVRFYKGEFVDFILEEIYEELLARLISKNKRVKWEYQRKDIISYIKNGSTVVYDRLLQFNGSSYFKQILQNSRKYYYQKEYLNNPKWDRVCITTLFTFYWDKTIQTINAFKLLCKNQSEIKVGGVAASLVPEQIFAETGIRPHIGLLNKSHEYDDNDIVIDYLPLDYSILNEIDYIYPENEGYYGYMTRGCVNRCSFCAVPQIEPEYNDFISLKKQLEYVGRKFGEKRNLLLLDNNVLASSRFDEIIDEIKAAGFYAGAMYAEPNHYEILIRDLKDLNKNYRGHIKTLVAMYQQLLKKCPASLQKEINSLLSKNRLTCRETASKDAILECDAFFSPLFEKYRNKALKARYVDFNQGVDARLLTPAKMARLSELSIRPLRIAFDSWALKEAYEQAIRLAAAYGIKNMSNYLLYNYDEPPVDLYRRMRLNIELCEELDVKIYSFPMKYHPIQDPAYFRDRTYLGKHWNRKFIRAIQAVLNSTKGKIGRGKSFFEKAFGANEKEFELLLYMPEPMIIYRLHYEKKGIAQQWRTDFLSLPPEKAAIARSFIQANDFKDTSALSTDSQLLKILKYYSITREEAAIEVQNEDIV